MLERIVDELYEASIAIELWPKVLDSLARLGGGAGASFVSGGRRPTRWMATPAMDELIRQFNGQTYQNSRLNIALKNHYSWFATDLDLFSAPQIEADPFYTEFMRPRGYGWCIGTSIHAPGADPVIFAVERAFKDGPAERPVVDLFDQLRPHLARSLLLSTRLGLERSRAMTEALATVGFPAAVLDRSGKAVAMNGLFELLIPSFAQDRQSRLTLADKHADRLFADAVAALKSRLRPEGVQSFPITESQGMAPTVAHVVPIRGAANDFFASSFALLILTPLEPGETPSTLLLEALFDLTPAEARVARGISEAATVAEIAARLGISRETVRAQLKAVFAKTGTERQAELVRLLTTLPRLS